MSGLISVDEALALLRGQAIAPGTETVALEGAQGRHLAEPVIARVSRPPAAVSAMDGYAVRLADVRNSGAKLTVIGEAPAGAPFEGRLDAGQAVRIFTGGEIPDGADHIVIQEDAMRDDDTLVCREAYDASQFIRPAGLDFTEGDTVLPEGARLGAGELALAASANVAALTVHKRLRVGILANGNELKAPGSDLAPGEIVNSNPAGLAALIREWGGDPVDLGIARDTLKSIRDSVAAAPEIDIFLPVGGASVGDHDLMRPAFAAEGFEPVFQKIAVKPGKPTWFSARDAQRVLGLPGNPASALVCAHLFLKPLLTGRSHSFVPARLAAPVAANGPREHFMRAALAVSDDGRLVATPAANQDSSLIRPFIESQALLRRETNAPALGAGDVADCLLMRGLQDG
ncbi:molybdopterin molybdotransferase MoeA [Henriciella aquimarina]|uniref:molybdopterin molybdotransferase MoeA n=1 Tax=Henriciella aquimarina TaxID=545261 RepID=UPI000A05B0C4|nr:molybdopterin molybdotransferase MoeA [Henriciella aquimarina]